MPSLRRRATPLANLPPPLPVIARTSTSKPTGEPACLRSRDASARNMPFEQAADARMDHTVRDNRNVPVGQLRADQRRTTFPVVDVKERH